MLTSLRNIQFYDNRLTTLEPWPYFVGLNGNMDHKAVVNLGSNSITSFTNKMEWKPNCSMKPTYMFLDLTGNSIRYVTDITRGWNFTFATIMCLYQNRRSQPSSYVSLDHNYLNCDCVDYVNYELLSLSLFYEMGFLNSAYCGKPESLSHMRVTSVPLKEFVCELTERCPSDCRCVHRPANATLHVYCSNRNLTALPLELPELPKSYTKYKLDFSNNRLLRRLEHRDYFVNTSILDVSNCGIETVDDWKELFHVNYVHLHGNQLASLPRYVAILNVSTAQQLSLYNNPWKCSCDNRWIAQWLTSVGKHLLNRREILCASPTRLRGKNILQISDEDFCVDPVNKTLAIGISSVIGAVLVLLSIGVIIYRLRVKLYTTWKFHPFDRDECLGEDMDYDVFISCSSVDNLPHGD